jgi:ankyrin repeat protein
VLSVLQNEITKQPTHLACEAGHIVIAQRLVEKYGVADNAKSTSQKNGYKEPLHWACRAGHFAIVKWLVLERGVAGDAGIAPHLL